MSCETNLRHLPRIIGHFFKDEKGICIECGEAFLLGEMGLIASAYDGGTRNFDLYCRDCFWELSDGDDRAWAEAES